MQGKNNLSCRPDTEDNEELFVDDQLLSPIGDSKNTSSFIYLGNPISFHEYNYDETMVSPENVKTAIAGSAKDHETCRGFKKTGTTSYKDFVFSRDYTNWTPTFWVLLSQLIDEFLKESELNFVAARDLLIKTKRLPKPFNNLLIQFQIQVPNVSRRTVYRHLKGYFNIPGYERFQYVKKASSGSWGANDIITLEKEIAMFKKKKNWSDEQFLQYVWSDNHRDEMKTLYNCLYELIDRDKKSIYNYLRRKYNPFKKKCKWTIEDEAELKKLVEKHGTSWSLIGKLSNRLPMHCRDHWRDYIQPGEINRSPWTIQEKEKLIKTVNQYLQSNPSSPIQWSLISKNMRNRHRHHCRWKYYTLISRDIHNSSPFKLGDSIWLIERMMDLNVAEERMIDWKCLSEYANHLWTADACKSHFERIKKTLFIDGLSTFSDTLIHLHKMLNSSPEETYISNLHDSYTAFSNADDLC
ncbi:Replication termination factor Rtf1 [Schizosaccharomyces pombe]|uniref:Replication termination factor 1 n=1 Tax=Schizosaccharomyces pombe (strain 972 / ATCC 24843) TaxID=284812 RepID=RTF_SCHPO|nr:replication termination factor Rtf1 [Schizosaccharomyces pombe]Q9UUI6.2 RecName: Full=Replication termination factor 1 [Schizosaccharomyces pombe 972h-]CAB52717.2 replication termination factor Rtf1 [Schizosaccharomyces pombe]CAF31329.1 replication termination factor 1 [Schizosaccharomyces pombe]|eukprot:NP_594730.2 replication termination factor Rtf1 [Schizosaccharomyces pombe]